MAVRDGSGLLWHYSPTGIFIPFSYLLTPQEIARRSRVEFFKRLYRTSIPISPVEVTPFDEYNYLLIDGNHRAVAALEYGESGVMAEIKEPVFRRTGRPKRIEEIVVENDSNCVLLRKPIIW